MDETGLLLSEAGRLVLRRDDGGAWRLDADSTVKTLVGRRVRVQGVRGGFDLIDVRSVTPC